MKRYDSLCPEKSLIITDNYTHFQEMNETSECGKRLLTCIHNNTSGFADNVHVDTLHWFCPWSEPEKRKNRQAKFWRNGGY